MQGVGGYMSVLLGGMMLVGVFSCSEEKSRDMSRAGMRAGRKEAAVVRVDVVRQQGDRIVVPKGALVSEEEGEGLFLVQDGIARKIEVETRSTEGSWVEVIGEIGKGDSVIVEGQEGLRDGMKVGVAPPVTWTPQGVSWTTKEVDARTGEEKVTGSGEAVWQGKKSPQ